MTRREKMIIKQEERAYLAFKRATNEQTSRYCGSKRQTKAIGKAIGQKWIKIYPVLVTNVR